MKRLQKIDELSLSDHYNICEDDECYFILSYMSGKGFNYNHENSLISNLKKGMDKKDNPDSIKKLSIIVQWASSSTFYTQKAKEKFLRMDKADIYLASFASVNPQEWTIVSMERSAPNSPSEIKLPDVCKQYHVKCIQLQEMFREIRDVY